MLDGEDLYLLLLIVMGRSTLSPIRVLVPSWIDLQRIDHALVIQQAQMGAWEARVLSLAAVALACDLNTVFPLLFDFLHDDLLV